MECTVILYYNLLISIYNNGYSCLCLIIINFFLFIPSNNYVELPGNVGGS
jgi:hypothetical protein